MDEIDEALEGILSSNYSRIIYNETDILKKLSDITLKELRTLEVILRTEKSGNNNSTSIAGVLGITLGTLTANIDRLIKKGLVVREKLEGDKRTNLLKITLKGKKVLRDYENEHLKIIRNALKNLTSKEKAVLVSLVNKF